MRILVLNGPNLNLLGKREPDVYGHETLENINSRLVLLAKELSHDITFFQSNCEGDLVDATQKALDNQTDFLIINPAAYTHTSVAWRDAVLAVDIAFIEVHLSNVNAREPFRKHSYFSDIAEGVISGFGARSYEMALLAAHNFYEEDNA